MNKITVEDISFSYEKRTLFSNLSATFVDSEFCAIIGPNGSGKTTLLKCIGHLLPVKSGNIQVNGQSINSFPPTELAKLISYVPQRQDNIFEMSVHDIVMMGLYPYQKRWQRPSSQDEAIVQEMMTRCNLLDLQERLCNELSGGEMQRTLIARAMAQQTPIMLLDEPLANLDVAHRYEIMDILARLNQQGVMILIILHEFPIAIEYATHALLMKEGKILLHDVQSRVLTPENLRHCFDLHNDFSISANGLICKKNI